MKSGLAAWCLVHAGRSRSSVALIHPPKLPLLQTRDSSRCGAAKAIQLNKDILAILNIIFFQLCSSAYNEGAALVTVDSLEG